MGLPGTTLLGRYRVIRPIARGAVATVYLAFDEHGKPYALKLFPKGRESRADREWKVGSALEHPRINPVLRRFDVHKEETGDAEGPAVLLAFAPGERFSEWRTHHPDGILAVFEALLEALAHMHERGFVHRDVKPENLVVDGTGQARLVDFDLSGPIGERFPKPVRLGTLAYIAPEQVRGQPPGPPADLYSAGVLLYWALSGELPFTGTPEEVLEAHLYEAAPFLESADPWMRRFMERLLAKDPTERFQMGKEALEAFRAL